MDTRQKIRMFNLAFRRPVSSVFQHELSDETRVLLGSILLEEVLEYCQKGLGLELRPEAWDVAAPECYTDDSFTRCKPGFGYNGDVDAVIKIGLGVSGGFDPGLDWKEIIDGLADVDVVNHFNAGWHGFNLNYATHVANESNMSKLDENGEPIINGVTPGYQAPDRHSDSCVGLAPGTLFDPTKPIGKILKGPNFREPDFAEVLAFGNPPYDPWDNVGTVLTPIPDVSIIPEVGSVGAMTGIFHGSRVKEGCELDHCVDHPEQTTANCEGGYGLAGGGVGHYYVCGECGNVFGKTNEGED